MLSRQDKIALKRANGVTACRECTRLKQKCDRKKPACGNCVRRGCENICPNGISPNTNSKAKSMFQQQHILTDRIQQLEYALGLLQSTVSNESHPLLTEDLLQIKLVKTKPSDIPRNPNDLADLVGTLTISPSGGTTYFGASGGLEVIFIKKELVTHRHRPSST